MKKIFGFILLFVFGLLLASCGQKDQNNLEIGVSFYPATDIIDLISDDLKSEGITLRKRVFSDYAQANPALADSELDGNFIQHQHYLNIFNQNYGASLVIAQPIYHAKFALYSSVYSSIDEIEEGQNVIVPNDAVNLARALLLLQSAGLIGLADNKVFDAKISDIISNPKNLDFQLATLVSSPGLYDEGGRKLAVMYPTYASKLNLSGDAERLYVELLDEITKTYAISFVVRNSDLENEKIKILIKYLTSDKVRNFINENYGWAGIPAF